MPVTPSHRAAVNPEVRACRCLISLQNHFHFPLSLKVATLAANRMDVDSEHADDEAPAHHLRSHDAGDSTADDNAPIVEGIPSFLLHDFAYYTTTIVLCRPITTPDWTTFDFSKSRQ
jgi:hypothetical protein